MEIAFVAHRGRTVATPPDPSGTPANPAEKPTLPAAPPTETAKGRPSPGGAGSDPMPATEVWQPATPGERFGALPATFGRYRLLRLLGRGGMGSVYLAHDTKLDRKVALKVPAFDASDGPQVRERFLREARAAATVHHANLCPVYDADEIDGVLFLTMAFLEGRTLFEVIRAGRKPLTERQAAALVRKLALALAEAHRKQVIHRDLKPGNIMLNPRGEPVIMDFGLARRGSRQDHLTASSTFPTLGGVRPREADLTQVGEIMGTPAYMAPEQALGHPEDIGPACDIYSLGVILYELLAGRLPFRGDAHAVLGQLLREEPQPPSTHRPGLGPRLEAICLKAMAKRPERRYRTMTEFAGVLTDYLKSGGPPLGERAAAGEELPFAEMVTATAPSSLPRRKRRQSNPYPVLIGVSLGAAVAATLLAIGLWKFALPSPRDGKAGPVASKGDGEGRGRDKRPAGPADVAPDPEVENPAPDGIDGREADAAVGRAKDLYVKGDFAGAAAEAGKALRLRPRLASAFLLRAEANNNLRNWRESIADCTEALRLDPSLSWAYTVRGVARANADEMDAGIDDLTQAIRMDPNDSTAYFNRAHYHAQKGELDPALVDYDAYLKLRAGDANAYLSRGRLHLRKGDPARAKADFARAVKLDATLAAKVPDVPPPALAWPAEPLRKGQWDAPDPGEAKPWLAADFTNKEGGLPTASDRGYRNGVYSLHVAGAEQTSAALPLNPADTKERGGAFVCEAVGKVIGPNGRWGLLIGQDGEDQLGVTLSVPGVLFGRIGPKGELKQLEPEPGRHPAIRRGMKGLSGRNRLLIVVSGRYAEVYVNGKAACDPVVLEKELTNPQVGLLCAGFRAKGATAEFESVVVRPAGSLPPPEKRGAKPKGK
jgi:serine/threonine protein kinase/Tfp pilus assembly protein PilF